jgi:hypothetical protein
MLSRHTSEPIVGDAGRAAVGMADTLHGNCFHDNYGLGICF